MKTVRKAPAVICAQGAPPNQMLNIHPADEECPLCAGKTPLSGRDQEIHRLLTMIHYEVGKSQDIYTSCLPFFRQLWELLPTND